MISNFKFVFNKLVKSENVKNSGWIIIGQFAQMLLVFVVGIISARYLGPSNYGVLNYTASYISFFTSIAALGMESVVMLKIVANPDEEEYYLGSAIVFRLFAGILSTIAIMAIVYLVDCGDLLKLCLVFFQSGQLVFKSFAILEIWFQKNLNSKYITVAKTTACFVVSLYKILLLITSKGVIWFALSNSFSDIIIAVILVVFYYKQNGKKLRNKYSYGFEVLSESHHFMQSNIMASVYIYTDKIMIEKMLIDGDGAVGLYSASVTVAALWTFLPNAVMISFQPTIMELKQKGNELMYQRRLEQLLSFISWMNFLFAGGITFLAVFIMRTLYGLEFEPAATSLMILAWSQCFAIISSVRSIWIVCEKKNQYVKKYVFLGTLLNIILNFILIPVMGINGAAFATLCTEFVICLIAPLFFKETREVVRIIFRAFGLRWYFEGVHRNEKS